VNAYAHIVAVFVVALFAGCGALREAFVEDRSTWSPAMVADREACDEEVVAGRWGWGRIDPFDADRLPRSFSLALRACLRSRGWKLGGIR
jgi:hypothetical protein